MISLTNNSLLMMERSLDFLWAKQTAILDNLANAETPGYKTKYVTFEERLAEKLQAAGRAGKPRQAVRGLIEDAAWTEHVSEESTRMDENGVNVTEQNVELVRTAYQMQYAMGAISSDLSVLRIAITG